MIFKLAFLHQFLSLNNRYLSTAKQKLKYIASHPTITNT